MNVIPFVLAGVVGLAVGWVGATQIVPAPEREVAIAGIDAAIASIVAQPNQCELGHAQAMKAPMAAIAVLKELRVDLSSAKPDPSSVKARLDELGKTNLPPAARSVISTVTRQALDLP